MLNDAGQQPNPSEADDARETLTEMLRWTGDKAEWRAIRFAIESMAALRSSQSTVALRDAEIVRLREALPVALKVGVDATTINVAISGIEEEEPNLDFRTAEYVTNHIWDALSAPYAGVKCPSCERDAFGAGVCLNDACELLGLTPKDAASTSKDLTEYTATEAATKALGEE